MKILLEIQKIFYKNIKALFCQMFGIHFNSKFFLADKVSIYANNSFMLRKSYEQETIWRRNIKNNTNFIFLKKKKSMTISFDSF